MKLSCYFCNKLLKNKISEHMTRVHSDEFDVTRILCKPPGSSERKLGWEKLKNLGNFNHKKKFDVIYAPSVASLACLRLVFGILYIAEGSYLTDNCTLGEISVFGLRVWPWMLQ